MDFTIKLAGVPIGIHALYDRSRAFCADYLCEEEPAFEVAVTEEMIKAERVRSGEDSGMFSDAYLERLAIYREIAEKMVERDVLLFHGSAICVDGETYLFTAPSGTGKSTHARLWRENLPALGHEVSMVNDDKPLLKFAEDGIFVCGTPWNGKHRLGENTIAPLRAICRICRGETNTIRKMNGMERLPVLLSQTYRPKEKEGIRKSLVLLGRLSQEVEMYELHCNMEPEAAFVSFKGMRS